MFPSLSIDFLNSITPEAFGSLSEDCIEAINSSQWQAIQPAQVAYIPKNTFRSLNCSVLNAFSSEQVAALSTPEQASTYYLVKLLYLN